MLESLLGSSLLVVLLVHPAAFVLLYAVLLARLARHPPPHSHLLPLVLGFHRHARAVLAAVRPFRAAFPRSAGLLVLALALALHALPPAARPLLLLVWLAPPLGWLRTLLAYLLTSKRDGGKTSLQSRRPTDEHESDRRSEGAEKGMIIRIEITIVEHQRWKEEVGWTGEITAEDTKLVGGRWTDGQGGEVSGPAAFTLPSPSVSAGASHPSWAWDAPHWAVVRGPRPSFPAPGGPSDPSSDHPWPVDPDGWTYADHTWSAFSCRPTHTSFVRKRRWTRPVLCTFAAPSRTRTEN
ncbi:hypothetical protein PTTG_00807 [Puccinia triticina 1-1 BBBD Race 1]|uniref:Pex24p domain-containing protein n=2 Tax=Puccinia triticina TaxID=208348 RepID=A0A180G4Z7_PUCT1|nr:uncharacterized protein PtA15_2A337 [Puccinia triticina]OAV87698.1 hypothetical protein PTTG_00807 [Puccinia triticina 1-1 BBBD Race 1]WAQ82024.1 hypothetical protein PtA15_2A337 [Puccinia triticina]WAR52897.1 hypothetical protein PtB15_2B325 [Puccinia triticina]